MFQNLKFLRCHAFDKFTVCPIPYGDGTLFAQQCSRSCKSLPDFLTSHTLRFDALKLKFLKTYSWHRAMSQYSFISCMEVSGKY